MDGAPDSWAEGSGHNAKQLPACFMSRNSGQLSEGRSMCSTNSTALTGTRPWAVSPQCSIRLLPALARGTCLSNPHLQWAPNSFKNKVKNKRTRDLAFSVLSHNRNNSWAQNKLGLRIRCLKFSI